MKQIEMIFKYIAVTLMALIIVTVTLQILAREVIYFNVSWTQEVAKFSFIWMSLIGAALGVRNSSHVSIDILVNKFPPKFQKAFSYMIESSVIIFLLVLFFQSLKLIMNSQGQTSPTLGVPLTYIYSGLIIFSVLSILFAVERIINVKRNINQKVEDEYSEYSS